jgi:hypothetical protein
VKHGGRNLPAASPTPHDSHSSPALSTGGVPDSATHPSRSTSESFEGPTNLHWKDCGFGGGSHRVRVGQWPKI